jgi:hypothetical protein
MNPTGMTSLSTKRLNDPKHLCQWQLKVIFQQIISFWRNMTTIVFPSTHKEFRQKTILKNKNRLVVRITKSPVKDSDSAFTYFFIKNHFCTSSSNWSFDLDE